MTADGIVRVGFVGFGSRSLAEAAKLSQIDTAEIVAAYDVAEDAVERGLARLNSRADQDKPLQLKKATSVAELLDQNLDVVYVSLPPHAHGQVEHQIIDAGAALVVEKPVANDLGTAREILAHLSERGTTNAVAFQWRYSDAVSWASQHLNGHHIAMVICNRVSALPGSTWWRRLDQGGGMLAEQHIHTLDLARLLAGEVRSLYSAEDYELFRALEGVTVPDAQITVAPLRNGGVLSLANACTQDHWAHESSNRVAQIVADGLTLDASAKAATVNYATGETASYQATLDENLELNRAIITAVATGDRTVLRSDYEDGLKTTVVALAARDSAKTGRPAHITDDQLGWTLQ